MKIYTKTGDSGDTGLVSGERVSKSSLRITSYGEIDELNSVIGMCRTMGMQEELDSVLHNIQRDLFSIGADLATPMDSKVKVDRLTLDAVQRLEEWIDLFDAQNPPLKNFILPGGNPLGSYLHFARTVCRRAERVIVALKESEEINEYVLIFVNRLSDLLFVLARLVNNREQVREEPWMKE